MANKRSLWCFSLAFLLVFTAGCKNKNFEILYPGKKDQFIGVVPNEVLIEYEVGAPTQILLNGIRVEQHFTMADGLASAPGDLLSAYYVQGDNTLSVEPHRFGPRQTFFLDNQGPRFIVTDIIHEPTRTLKGELLDPSKPRDIQINGIAGIVDNQGNFEIIVEPAERYYVTTVDEHAQIANYQYADRATIVEDILRLNADQSAIDDLVPFAQELLKDIDIADLLGSADANTLFDENVQLTIPKFVIVPEKCVLDVCTPEIALGPFTVNVLSIDASLTTLSFEEIEFNELVLNSGSDWKGFTFDATVYDADLGIKLNADVLSINSTVKELLRLWGAEDDLSFLGGEFSATIGVPSLRVASDIGLEATDGDVDLTIEAINALGLGSLNSDFNLNINLPSAINTYSFGLANAVVSVIEAGIDAARDLIVDLFLGKLVPLIANLILDPLVNELQVRLGLTLNNGAFLTSFIGIDDIDVINNNTLKVNLNGRIGAETATGEPGDIDIGIDLGFPDVLQLDDHLLPDLLGIPESLGLAPGIVPEALGFRITDTAVPDPDSYREMESEVGLSISANLLNQALLAIYEGGVLSPSVPILNNPDTGAYLITEEENANERILFRPQSHPEIVFKGDQITVAYLTLDRFEIRVERLEAGEWVEDSGYEINAELAIKLSHDDETGLNIGLISPDFDIFYEFGAPGSGRINKGQIKNSTDELLLASLTVLVVEQINAGLQFLGLAGPLQLTAGEVTLEIQPLTIQSIGEPREHFGISASLNAL